VTQDPFVGTVIDGRYEIQTRIGEGGMGVVYKARQMSIDRVIALKMLNQQVQGDQTWVQRFYNEAKACSRLQHPNTVRMFDFGQTQDGRLFMTMELLDGPSLRHALQAGPLAAQRVAKILIQCCASLDEAHASGIIHRDIKPDNVFLLNMAGSPDFVKLLDFSVAKLLEGGRMKTEAGVVFGTPQYMSPEHGQGLPLDTRSDLYALGVLAFEMVSGRVPYNDDNPMTVLQMHLRGPAPPLPDSIPQSMQQVVRRAMEKDPARRYQSAGEMMQHCQQVFAELTAGAGGSVAVGAGGIPRSLIAPSLQQLATQPAPGYVQPAPQAKTILGQPGPLGMVPTAVPPAQAPAVSGLAGPRQSASPTASPIQKTIVDRMAPQSVGGPPVQQGQPGMMPSQGPVMMPTQGMPAGPLMMPTQGTPGAPGPGMIPGPGMMPQTAPQGGLPPQAPGAPIRTVMLQPSDGVVSVARWGGTVAPLGGVVANAVRGPSTTYWIVCLLAGVSVGVVGYFIVLKL
jgi:serine/threonine-protein kinase